MSWGLIPCSPTLPYYSLVLRHSHRLSLDKRVLDAIKRQGIAIEALIASQMQLQTNTNDFLHEKEWINKSTYSQKYKGAFDWSAYIPDAVKLEGPSCTAHEITRFEITAFGNLVRTSEHCRSWCRTSTISKTPTSFIIERWETCDIEARCLMFGYVLHRGEIGWKLCGLQQRHLPTVRLSFSASSDEGLCRRELRTTCISWSWYAFINW